MQHTLTIIRGQLTDNRSIVIGEISYFDKIFVWKLQYWISKNHIADMQILCKIKMKG